MSYIKYSGWDQLPYKRTGDHVTKGCIVLEGGAFRGLYTGGALDALMESDINLECTIGVSAGAMNGICYATGQIGYASRINLGHRNDKKYVGFGARKNNGGIIGFDVAFNQPDGMEPLALDRIPALNKRYVAVVTNCMTGKEEYVEADGTRNILPAIQASASMPFVSKPVDVSGTPCLDGGCACKIGYQWALDQNYEKIVIIRTRPKDYRKTVKDSRHTLTRLFYRKYPKLVEALIRSNEDYNRQCDEIDSLEAAGRVFVISPSKSIEIARLEKDVEKLGVLYHLGYDDTMNQKQRLIQYLNQ